MSFERSSVSPIGSCPAGRSIRAGRMRSIGFWREVSGDASVREMYPHDPVQPGGRLPGLLDQFPNLWCDLSAPSGLNAMSRDPNHARRFIETYQDRVLFGRDYWDDALLGFL